MAVNKEQKQDIINKAYDLRLRGKSYRQIGSELGISAATAYRYVTDYLDSVTLPLVDQVRKTEVDRLQRYLDVLDARIDDGDDKAVNIAIRVSERLCKMLGVDQPVTQTVEHVEKTQLDASIQGLLDEMADRNAQEKQRAAAKGKVEGDEG